jgi:hypothetical protein
MDSNIGIRPSELPNDLKRGRAILQMGSDSLLYKTNIQSDDMLICGLDSSSYWFLAFSGMVHYGKSPWSQWALRGWSVFLGLSFVSLWIVNVLMRLHTISDAILEIVFIAQIGGAVLGTYFNASRLSLKYSRKDADSFKKMLPVAVVTVLSMFSGSATVTIMYYALLHNDRFNMVADAVDLFAIFILCLNLGANVFILLVDTDIALESIQSLHCVLGNNEQLTLNRVESVRLLVAGLVNRGFTGNSVIMATAITNVAAVFALVVAAHDQLDFVLLNIALYLLREVILCGVGLWYAARVNESYDSLLEALSHHIFRQLNEHDGLERGTSPTGASAIILCCLQASPIAYPVAGMTLRRKDVVFRFGLWLFGIVLSILSKNL